MTEVTFNANSTAEQVLAGINLEGKRVLITGASGGLGAEAARVMAKHNAEVIIAARDATKTDNLIATIRDQSPSAKIHFVNLELADLDSVRRCAKEVMNKFSGLDVMIANAGIMATEFGLTKQGFEQQFGVNHLGHFLLVNLLVPMLDKRHNARVVILSSAGHRLSPVDLEDPNFERSPYNKWHAYGRAKSANALYALGLNQRLQTRGITANAVHPGMIVTELGRYMSADDLRELGKMAATTSAAPPAYKSIAAGAATEVWAATSPQLEGKGGLYLEDCHIAGPAVEGSGGGYQPFIADLAQANALWELSERLVGQTFDFSPK